MDELNHIPIEPPSTASSTSSRIVSRLIIIGGILVVLTAMLVLIVPVWLQRDSVQRIRRAGGYVYYAGQCDASGKELSGRQPNGPPWLRAIIGDDFCDVPVSVRMQNHASVKVRGDKFMPAIGRLPHLRLVSLTGSPLSVADLDHLSRLRELKMLGLGEALIGDADLAALKDLPIEWLSFFRTHVSDKGLSSLQNMHTLKYLDLTRTRVSDQGLGDLEGLPNLRSLNIARTKVTREGAARFQKKCPHCKVQWEPFWPGNSDPD